MKRELLISCLLLFSIMLNARIVSMSYASPNDDIEGQFGPRHAPAVLPQVSYEDSVLSIAAPYELSDVAVVIRDEDGEILYSYSTLFIIGTLEVTLPCTEDAMYSVELIYSGHHLIGYF